LVPNCYPQSPLKFEHPVKWSYTIEDAIEKIGFGRFQIKLLAMVGFAWVSRAFRKISFGK